MWRERRPRTSLGVRGSTDAQRRLQQAIELCELAGGAFTLILDVDTPQNRLEIASFLDVSGMRSVLPRRLHASVGLHAVFRRGDEVLYGRRNPMATCLPWM